MLLGRLVFISTASFLIDYLIRPRAQYKIGERLNRGNRLRNNVTLLGARADAFVAPSIQLSKSEQYHLEKRRLEGPPAKLVKYLSGFGRQTKGIPLIGGKQCGTIELTDSRSRGRAHILHTLRNDNKIGEEELRKKPQPISK